MTGWRFYPLRDAIDLGILLSPDESPAVARFIRADALKPRKRKAAA